MTIANTPHTHTPTSWLMCPLPAPQVNVAWQLRHVPPGLGGFCAIPGSQRARLVLPRERPTSIDLPEVAHVPMAAGDVLLFLAGQVCCGPPPPYIHQRRLVIILRCDGFRIPCRAAGLNT